MSKDRLLYIIIAILVTMNLILVGSMWMKSNNHHFRSGDANIKQHFSFSDQQLANFQVKKADHQKRIEPLLKNLAENSKLYYDVLTPIQNKDSLLRIIQDLDVKIYETNLRHFEDLKAICTKDQYPALEEFIVHLLNRKNKTKPR